MLKIYSEYGEKGGKGNLSEIRKIIHEQSRTLPQASRESTHIRLNQGTVNEKNKDIQTENGQMNND